MPHKLVIPGGLVDVHVHFRDPGMPTAETRRTGAAAARAGGFSLVVTMPNTVPAGDSPAWIRAQTDDATLPVQIAPSACITAGRLGRTVADLEACAAAGAVLFTDDGSYVSEETVMREAMRRAARLNIAVAEHAVVPARLGDPSAGTPPFRGMMPRAAETEAVRRDLRLCRDTGCRLHIQHVSFGETVELIRDAQREGLPVTGEATPHHLYLSADMIPGDDPNWKMAPPLALREDVRALRKAVMDGVLFFATDHAPHPPERKRPPWSGAVNGIVGLETAAAVTYQALVVEEGMSEADWIRRWTDDPRALLAPALQAYPKRDVRDTTLEIGGPRRIDPATFRSLSHNTPFAGMSFAAHVAE